MLTCVWCGLPARTLPSCFCSCDYIWLPHFEFINVVGFSQDRVVRYGVQLGDNNSVAWWQHIQVRACLPAWQLVISFQPQFSTRLVRSPNSSQQMPLLEWPKCACPLGPPLCAGRVLHSDEFPGIPF